MNKSLKPSKIEGFAFYSLETFDYICIIKIILY